LSWRRRKTILCLTSITVKIDAKHFKNASNTVALINEDGIPDQVKTGIVVRNF
jgi:hypothetical protein